MLFSRKPTFCDNPISRNFVAVDVETANDSPNSICSIGVVKIENGRFAKKYYSLVKPIGDFANFAKINTEINGIHPQDVVNSPTFREIFPDLRDIVGDNVLIAHNAMFDATSIFQSALAIGLEYVDLNFIDTLSISRRLYNLPNYKLDTVSEHLGINLEHHHNSLSDSAAAAMIFYKMSQTIERLEPSDLIFTRNFVKKIKKPVRSLPPSAFIGINAKDIKTSKTEFNQTNPLFGKEVVVTGEIPGYSRDAAWQKIVDMGGRVNGGVRKSTDILIDADPNTVSSKERLAIKYGIKIITDKDLLKIFAEYK